MAFIRNCFVMAVLVFCVIFSKAQTVYYPAGSSQLLKSTAADLAMLLQKAVTGSHFNIQQYQAMPASGIVLVYDPSYTDNGSCKVESDGSSVLKFTAAEDNGLNFGVYQYLNQSGFRFYQPGSIWEVIPVLGSPYKNINTTYKISFRYKNWFISGGHNRWAMDNNTAYGWDTYYGEEGHNWALYQRRNGMSGAYRFAGHRGDIMSGAYLSELQNNPCYVACYDGSRQANTQSVPDIHSNPAMQLWSTSIEKQYTQFKNTIFGNTTLYADYYRNYNYNYNNIGIEVPDGAHWGNSKDNNGCNVAGYPAESDQHFTLANFTAQKLNAVYPGKRAQLYAYSGHADVPSFSISDQIDVQVVPGAFQNESSPVGLMNRWYNKTNAISEYHYMNIPQWGGETPMFYRNDLDATLQRAKEKNNQGIVWEASPAKFASLPFLFAANNFLKDGTPVDSSLHEFCDLMFASAGNTIYSLLQMWSDEKTVTISDFIPDNKYKLPLYFRLLNDAAMQTQNAGTIVQQRIMELKAYLHYMALYYDWLFDQRSNTAKKEKAAALCLYLARVNKMQIVNSYFLIADITSRYPATDEFNSRFNVQGGTAYQNGSLAQITPAELEQDFQNDLGKQVGLIGQYSLESAAFIKEQFTRANLLPLKKINVKLTYTNGSNYPNRAEFYIDAPAAGTFSIAYAPHFDMPGKGYINFTLEAGGKALQVIKDFSIGNDAKPGVLYIAIPAAGVYKLSVVSKYKSAVDLVISTNGNHFYRNGPFLGKKTENYRSDLRSLPGYFYVPGNIKKLYFSINNSNPGGRGFATADDISKAFVIRDNHGTTLQPRLVTPNDSALFYIEVPVGSSSAFWQATKMEQYNLCFANISNVQWYAEPKSCSLVDFTVSVVRKNGECVTRLTAVANSGNLKWEINEPGRPVRTEDRSVVDLAPYSSPNTVITLTVLGGCSITKRIGDDAKNIKALETCASGSPAADATPAPVMYPNPSSGLFSCIQQKDMLTADEISVTNSKGNLVGKFKNTGQFNISQHPAGIYWYRMLVKGQVFCGKLVKL